MWPSGLLQNTSSSLTRGSCSSRGSNPSRGCSEPVLQRLLCSKQSCTLQTAMASTYLEVASRSCSRQVKVGGQSTQLHCPSFSNAMNLYRIVHLAKRCSFLAIAVQCTQTIVRFPDPPYKEPDYPRRLNVHPDCTVHCTEPWQCIFV